MPFAIVNYMLHGSLLLSVLALFITYIGMQLGHGNFYHMNGVSEPDKPEALEWLVRKFYKRTNTKLYSWLCFGVKGFVIGLAVFPYGLALIPLWPLAYYLSWKFWNGTEKAEYISGAFAGLIIYLSL